jgi:predicted RNA binding protein YcfA (HicA-like mRNA interferase family)
MLARLPGATAKQVIRTLQRAGFVADPRKATSHVALRHPLSKRTTTVPIHSKELPRGLVKKIIKDVGLTEEEFRKLL